MAELVVCVGNLGETWKLGFREDKVVDYGKGVADLRDLGEQDGSEQLMGRAKGGCWDGGHIHATLPPHRI